MRKHYCAKHNQHIIEETCTHQRLAYNLPALSKSGAESAIRCRVSEPKTTLGEQLRKLRVAKGHATARSFAKVLGISENRYSRYERGEAVPKLGLAQAICAELGITPNELYGCVAAGRNGTQHDAAGPRAPIGFAEEAQHDLVMSGSSPSSLHVSAYAADIAAWRLAMALSSAMHRAGSAKAAGAELFVIRTTADIYLRLRQDPFTVLAQSLQSLHPGDIPAETEHSLAGEVQAFLAAIEPAPSRPPARR